MNYIRQMNAFYQHLLKNPMPPKAQSLYLALFHTNNLADWKEVFIVANVSLQAVCSMTESDLLRSRKLLIREGLIEYTKSSGKRAGKYKLVNLYDSLMKKTNDGPSDGPSDGPNDGPSEGGNDGPTDGRNAGKVTTFFIDKQKHKYKLKRKPKQKPEKKEEEKKESSPLTGKAFKEIVQAFNQNIHPITPFEAETLSDWLDQGMSKEVMIRGIKEAVLSNARSMKYINAVLMNWSANNLTTVEALDAHERQRCDGKRREGGLGNGREGFFEGGGHLGGSQSTGKAIVIDESKFFFEGGVDEDDPLQEVQ